MANREAKRISRPLTPNEEEKVREWREGVSEELPELIERDKLRKEASEEATLSGELRRAVHASDRSIPEIAVEIGISAVALDEFLTGERTLRSDVLDRLAAILEFELTQSHPEHESG